MITERRGRFSRVNPLIPSGVTAGWPGTDRARIRGVTPGEWRATCPLGGGPYSCPCCHLLTLDARADFEICGECGWEDDGQDDPHADETWSGPNGSLSLSDARANYAANIAPGDDPSSVANGGQGIWWTAVEELRKNHPEQY